MESEKLNLFFSTLDQALEDNPSSFENLDADWLGQLQAQANRTYQQLPVPNFKEKSWSKFSGLEINGKFSLIGTPKIVNDSLDEQAENLSARITVCESEIRFQVGAQAAQQGLVACSLEDAAEQHAALLAGSLSLAEVGGEDKLAAFNAAASRHGFLLYVPANVQFEKAVEIRVQSEQDQVVFPTNVWIILEQRAQASIVLRQTSSKKEHKSAITSLVLALDVREDASLHLLEAQQYDRSVWAFNNEASRLAAGASLDQFVLDMGSTVNKRVLTATLQGDGSQASITGIYTPQSDQVFIYDTHQNHNASHTTSDLLFNGVLDGSSYALWKGNVYVASGTKGADGFQINRNLLLDEAAHAESIPGLEIIADDVRCSHAVTLSSVDPEQMFFLESRGIGQAEAEELIVDGFLEAASNRMKDKKLQEIIREAVK
jgi:Fe-S cluster assembly protein SufD